MAMRALGFEPKKEEIKKMISDIDKVSSYLHNDPITILANMHFIHLLCLVEQSLVDISWRELYFFFLPFLTNSLLQIIYS